MLKLFQSYITDENLCTEADTILIAVSGGADSVALLHLFSKTKYKIVLAHCNFALRNSESDNDELFVKQLVEKYNIKSHFIRFDTKNYAAENKLSIEMAARELRYEWFSKLCNQNNYSLIATGHHLNDSIETLFINLTRGTGINGITGIKPKNANVIRPLLFATRKQIEDYLNDQNIAFCNDSSNQSNVYVRNIIRNEIIPKFKEINPSFEATMLQNLHNLNQTARIYNNEILRAKKNVIQSFDDKIIISKTELEKYSNNSTLLFEIISDFGFSLDSVTRIMQGLKSESGLIFYSSSHKLLIDRSEIIIEKISEEVAKISINTIDDFKVIPIKIQAELFESNQFEIIRNKAVACIDADKIMYPLVLRKWKKGDTFQPLGMKNKKKLSDFFIDQKTDRFTKEKTWILESAKEIVWLVGMRIDDRFKVTTNTKQVLQLTLQ